PGQAAGSEAIDEPLHVPPLQIRQPSRAQVGVDVQAEVRLDPPEHRGLVPLTRAGDDLPRLRALLPRRGLLGERTTLMRPQLSLADLADSVRPPGLRGR